MPRIINAFQGTDPAAKAISDLGIAMFGDKLTPALQR